MVLVSLCLVLRVGLVAGGADAVVVFGGGYFCLAVIADGEGVILAAGAGIVE